MVGIAFVGFATWDLHRHVGLASTGLAGAFMLGSILVLGWRDVARTRAFQQAIAAGRRVRVSDASGWVRHHGECARIRVTLEDGRAQVLEVPAELRDQIRAAVRHLGDR